MPRADKHPTTPRAPAAVAPVTPAETPDQARARLQASRGRALRPNYTIPNPATGDALLMALAAAFREADAAGAAFEDAAVPESGIMQRHMASAAEAHYRRRDVIEQAICVLPATDLAGAVIQIEALARLSFRGAEHHISQAEDLREFACRSIFTVLARATGRTADDGLALDMVEARDDFGSDPQAKRAALAAYFEANGLGDVATAPAASARARAAGVAGRAGA